MGDEPRVFLVISTGRCGTQWLATTLTELYSERAEVTHEPLEYRYKPRRYFRRVNAVQQLAADSDVSAHLDRIEATIRERYYIETGWPLFAALPLFLERFRGRVGLIHLTRHPVPTAISHMVHQCYGGSPRDDGYTRLAALDPFCPGVFQPHYMQRWEQLSPYEKCLFWWTEVHLYAEEIARLHPDVPIHKVKSEDMLAGDEATLRALSDAFALPYVDDLRVRSERPVDRWNHRTQIDFDWRGVFEHPATVDVAQRLGYDVSDVDETRLQRRYKGEPHVEAKS